MIYKSVNSTFPSQVVPDEVKQSYEYGSEVGKAIENEWFKEIDELVLAVDLVTIGKTFIDYVYMLEESNLFRNIKMNYLQTVICLT